jgi:hypothetical protein
VHEVQPQKFADVSSLQFSEDHLDQAKIYFAATYERSHIYSKQESLTFFPWLIFDVTKIPVTDEHFGYLPAKV